VNGSTKTSTLDEIIEAAERRILELSMELEPLRLEREKLIRMVESMRREEAPKRRRLAPHERMEQILKLLETKPGLRNREIAESLGLTEGRISQLVDRLEAEGVAVRRDGGVWPRNLSMDSSERQVA
jgi:hypothetical protein